jgi:hypothetical protein
VDIVHNHTPGRVEMWKNAPGAGLIVRSLTVGGVDSPWYRDEGRDELLQSDATQR